MPKSISLRIEDIFAAPTPEEMDRRRDERCNTVHEWLTSRHSEMRTDGSYRWDILDVKVCNICGKKEVTVV